MTLALVCAVYMKNNALIAVVAIGIVMLVKAMRGSGSGGWPCGWFRWRQSSCWPSLP